MESRYPTTMPKGYIWFDNWCWTHRRARSRRIELCHLFPSGEVAIDRMYKLIRRWRVRVYRTDSDGQLVRTALQEAADGLDEAAAVLPTTVATKKRARQFTDRANRYRAIAAGLVDA